MGRLISADTLVERIKKSQRDGGNESFAHFVRMVNRAPTIDAEPVRHRRWKEVIKDRIYKCSACGDEVKLPYFYCPRCGALMNADEPEGVRE